MLLYSLDNGTWASATFDLTHVPQLKFKLTRLDVPSSGL